MPDARDADTGGVTTFDDTGIFELVDEEQDAPERPQRARVVAVLVVAAALVVAGVTWLLLARSAGAPAPEQLSVALLDRQAEPTDVLPSEVVEQTGVDPTSSRFAVRTAAGQHYAALRWDGSLCLVAVPDGDAARVVCVAPSAAATATLTGPDESRVRLGTDTAPAPDASEGWRAAGANVWVLDAPPAG